MPRSDQGFDGESAPAPTGEPDMNLYGQRAHALPVTLPALGKPCKFDTSCGGSRRARPLRRSAGRQEAVRMRDTGAALDATRPHGKK